MTILERDSIVPSNRVKFVRVGRTIAFDEEIKSHADIAREHHLGCKSSDPAYDLELDDAGVMAKRDKLTIGGCSNKCLVKGDPFLARKKTGEVAGSTTGEEVDVHDSPHV